MSVLLRDMHGPTSSARQLGSPAPCPAGHHPLRDMAAEERRLARDGGRYTLREFLRWYGNTHGLQCWQEAMPMDLWRRTP